MARGYNVVHLVGCVSSEPELRYSGAGTAILNLSLAGSDFAPVGNEWRELAWYHRVTVFGKQAEMLVEILEVGTPVFTDARLNFSQWQTPDGSKRSSLQLKGLVVQKLKLTGRGSDPYHYDSLGQPRLKDAVNYVCVVGNLTRDADLRYTPNGNAVTRLSIAVNESYKKGNEWVETAHFVEAQVWRDVAEQVGSLQKGAGLMVTGRFVTDSWEAKDGSGKRYQNRIDGARVEVLGKAQTAAPKPSAYKPPAPSSSLDIDDEFPPEEDLPF